MGKRKLEESDDNPNKEISDMLYELAEYEKNVTGNVHKYNAYRQAGKSLANYPKKISSGKEAKKLPGVGQKIADKIDEYLQTGKLKKLEEIRKNEKYQAILLLTRVSGIGPAKAKELVDLGIRSLEDLEKHKDKLTHHQKIGLKYFHDFELRIPRKEISEIEKVIRDEITGIDGEYIVTICGSYRRGKQSSGDIDCLVSHPNYTSNKPKKNKVKHESMLKKLVKRLEEIDLLIDTIALGSTKYMGVCKMKNKKTARRLDMRLTPHDQYFCSILYFTGSDLFNKNMRTHALQQGYTLNEYSLRPIGETGVPGNPVPLTSERDIFEYINYEYREPHERDA
ncbi:hypothetical protein RUM44_009649 [Polyplax serrata]|uniref:DNA polymerase n=1 Tax=Polyplax serrata TaxID=468196 RepID=A0ABR1ATA9_POLSC